MNLPRVERVQTCGQRHFCGRNRPGGVWIPWRS